jgi:hypothetical protein
METQNRAIPPTNYLRIFKVNVGVEGQYVVDLSLPPPSVPGAIAQDTDPKNLSLHTTCGRIDAEIWVIHDGSGNPKRVTLNMCTDSGPIRAILVSLPWLLHQHFFFSQNNNNNTINVQHSTTLPPPMETATLVQPLT